MSKDLPMPGDLARSKLWWKIWGGHVWFAGAVLAMIGAILAIWAALNETDSLVVFIQSVIAMLLFFVAVCFGILAANKLQTKADRFYLTREADHLTGQEPPGRVGTLTVLHDDGSPSEDVSEAHSLSQEDSDVR